VVQLYSKRDLQKTWNKIRIKKICVKKICIWNQTYIAPYYMGRHLYIWKETYVYEKRPIYVVQLYTKRDLQKTWKKHITRHITWEDIYIYEKRPIYVKRDLRIWKETYICGTTLYEKRPAKNLGKTYNTPYYMGRHLYIWKETYVYEKRPMYMEQLYMKRDLGGKKVWN